MKIPVAVGIVTRCGAAVKRPSAGGKTLRWFAKVCEEMEISRKNGRKGIAKDVFFCYTIKENCKLRICRRIRSVETWRLKEPTLC